MGNGHGSEGGHSKAGPLACPPFLPFTSRPTPSPGCPHSTIPCLRPRPQLPCRAVLLAFCCALHPCAPPLQGINTRPPLAKDQNLYLAQADGAEAGAGAQRGASSSVQVTREAGQGRPASIPLCAATRTACLRPCGICIGVGVLVLLQSLGQQQPRMQEGCLEARTGGGWWWVRQRATPTPTPELGRPLPPPPALTPRCAGRRLGRARWGRRRRGRQQRWGRPRPWPAACGRG